MKTQFSHEEVNHIIQALSHEIRDMRYYHGESTDNFETILGLFCWLCHSTGNIEISDELPF